MKLLLIVIMTMVTMISGCALHNNSYCSWISRADKSCFECCKEEQHQCLGMDWGFMGSSSNRMCTNAFTYCYNYCPNTAKAGL
jgi:hypothetical protein